MLLPYELHLRALGQPGKEPATKQQLQLDLALLPKGEASTFEDLRAFIQCLGEFWMSMAWHQHACTEVW